MGQHISGNPKILPLNMEGAGGLRLANFLYNAAPKDGTVIGTINRGAHSRANREIAPIGGRELQTLVADIYRTPANVVAKTKAILK